MCWGRSRLQSSQLPPRGLVDGGFCVVPQPDRTNLDHRERWLASGAIGIIAVAPLVSKSALHSTLR
jgi:hypothetical protein